MDDEIGGIPKEAIDFDAAKEKANFEAKVQKDYFRQPAESAFNPDKKLENRTPVGEVILGDTDPRGLTEEEFRQSPNLLYHGSGQDIFEFDETFDYRTTFLNEMEGHTVGSGLYTTPEKANAQVYSEIRGTKESGKIYEFMPFEAKILDLRAEENPRLNAPVPQGLAEAWRDYFETYFRNKYPTGQPDLTNKTPGQQVLESGIFMVAKEYLNLLKGRVNQGEPMHLRMLLDRSEGGMGRDTEHASSPFTDFMLQKGYDGVIYNEGGDRADQKHVTSVVFYNPKRVGTYENWQRRKQEGK